MIAQKVFSEKKFTLINALVLGVLFLYTWFKSIPHSAPVEDIIYWPGAYFLSVWILSHGILYHCKTSSVKGQRPFIVKHMLGSLLFGMSHFLLTGVLILVLERFFRLSEHYSLSAPAAYARTSWHFISDGVIWYWIYIAVMLLFHFRLKLQQERQKMISMQRDLITSDLDTLNSELNPHFLFNAMNSIAMKVRLGENKLAVSMIASLNDLLRTVLYRRKIKVVSLKEELELLEKYLMIERTRYGDQVKVEQQFPDTLLKVMVPQMLLQPLVENAFKHGVRENMQRQHIRISGERRDDTLVLTVFNTTASKNWIVTENNRSRGIGLPNIIRRLRGLYGTAFRFQSHYLEEGISFRITIPLEIT